MKARRCWRLAPQCVHVRRARSGAGSSPNTARDHPLRRAHRFHQLRSRHKLNVHTASVLAATHAQEGHGWFQLLPGHTASLGRFSRPYYFCLQLLAEHIILSYVASRKSTHCVQGLCTSRAWAEQDMVRRGEKACQGVFWSASCMQGMTFHGMLVAKAHHSRRSQNGRQQGTPHSTGGHRPVGMPHKTLRCHHLQVETISCTHSNIPVHFVVSQI